MMDPETLEASLTIARGMLWVLGILGAAMAAGMLWQKRRGSR